MNENENVLMLENLLAELRSLSSHEKIEILTHRQQARVESLPREEGSIPFVVPNRFSEHALSLLCEIEAVIRRLEQQLGGVEGVGALELREGGSRYLGEIFFGA